MEALFPIVAAMAALMPPERPAQRPWPGGPWTGDDAQKGVYYAPGAFPYTPRAEYQAWEAREERWMGGAVAQGLVWSKGASGPAILGLDAARSVKFQQQGRQLVGESRVSVYGGSGTVRVICSRHSRTIRIELSNLDFEQTAAALRLPPAPIRITGVIGKLIGELNDDQGTFVASDFRVTSSAISRVDLSIDARRGEFSAVAQTRLGEKKHAGKLPGAD